MTAAVFDFAIVGAGMAGASLAAELSADARVVVLEAEDAPGYHATGRSAAFWEECYGGPQIVPLTIASGPFLRDGGFLTNRGALYIARADQDGAVDGFFDQFGETGATIERLDRDQLAPRIPGLKPEWQHAVWEPACSDIDVAALHQHYLSAMQRSGAKLQLRSGVRSARNDGDCWIITCVDGKVIRAKTLLNAAGAWADNVAQMAGAEPLGITPLRRTVAQLRLATPPPGDLALVLDIMGGFYFKPENGRLWLSPHDETPTEPCDAAPEELDVATAIARLAEVVDWQVEAVEHKWAGLRSFAPDRRPIYGWDAQVPDFAWFAGQGGFGIQTAPAAARLMAQMLLGNGRDVMTSALDATLYTPTRFVPITP